MKYRREIDGLRAVAVLPVILFHAGFGLFRGGFVGVDVFFVISGFLITSIIVGEHEAGRFSLVSFYERRARRILPALFLVLALCLPAAWAWMPPLELQEFSQSLVAVAVFASNLLFWHKSGYFSPGAEQTPLLHTWSLAVEEQYYLLFPLLLPLLLAGGRRLRTAATFGVVLVLSLFAAQWASTHAPSADFYLLPTRGWELLAGATLALAPAVTEESPFISSAQIASLGGLGLILYAVFTFDSTLPFPGLYAVVPVLGTVLILRYAQAGTLVARLLGHPLCVGIGAISYGTYLWHQPLLAFARLRRLNEPEPWLLALMVAASLALAWFSWRYVEGPFRDRRRIDRRVVFTLAGTGIAGFALLGLAGHVSHGFPGRFNPRVYRLLSIGRDHRARRDDGGCNLTDMQTAPAHCQRGAPGATSRMAVWGDSYGAALVHELGAELQRRGESLVQYTKNGCPASVGIATRPASACEEFGPRVLAELAHSSVTTVVVYSRWQGYVENRRFDNGEGGIEHGEFVASDVGSGLGEAERLARLGAGIKAGVDALLRMGKQVVLVYPSPEVGWDVPRYLAARAMAGDRAEPLTTSRASFAARTRRSHALLDAIGQHPRLLRVHPEYAFCDGEHGSRCHTEREGEPLYYDNGHLADSGARLVVGEILAALEPPGPASDRRVSKLRQSP